MHVPAPSRRASAPPLSAAAPSPHSASSALSPVVCGALSPVAVAERVQTQVLNRAAGGNYCCLTF